MLKSIVLGEFHSQRDARTCLKTQIGVRRRAWHDAVDDDKSFVPCNRVACRAPGVLRRVERPTCDVDGRAKNAKMMKEKGSEGLKNGPLQVAFLAACPPSLRTDTLVVGAQRHMRSFDNHLCYVLKYLRGMKRPREVLATAPGRGTRVRWTFRPRRALRYFQALVRGLINEFRMPYYRQWLQPEGCQSTTCSASEPEAI